MKDFFMEEFDKKINTLLEKSTEDLMKELIRIEKQYPDQYRMEILVAVGASMRFTKNALREYHSELLDYLERHNQ